jgi:hypothetical protein
MIARFRELFGQFHQTAIEAAIATVTADNSPIIFISLHTGCLVGLQKCSCRRVKLSGVAFVKALLGHPLHPR